ncbi:putative serine/threonine protein kinase [Brazilian marseillevirus]|uniref:putative serine/threonine protein kinase n=1 Tax=Brazilian marseillevirus TaxID=1813599 RepID=UPI0007824A69|nr:putative serine/threonine protein kinase [Brazilian marseillevirus]AMQ10695.1 putative serine/threonine protein kinase [Brazilian marseillevirus]
MKVIQKSSHPLQATIVADVSAGFVMKSYSSESYDSQKHPEKTIYDMMGEGHKNICRLVKFERTNLSQTLVLEYLPFDLSKRFLNMDEMPGVFKDICNGLAFLHKNGIIHADLKPSNILYDGKTAKICDFGLSIFCGDQTVSVSHEIVTLHYRPPELLIDPACHFAYEVDIWSLGCVFAELWRGNPLWSFDKRKLMEQHAIHQFIPIKVHGISPEFQTLLRECLNYNPKMRPNIEQILKKYFTQYFIHAKVFVK